MGITEEGIKAERWFLETAMLSVPVFQPDAITFEKGKYIINEVKHQSHYKTPPFDGHGLPPNQVSARMEFYFTTGIRCRLIVLEKDTNIVYYQWIDILENGESITTSGIKSRKIYPLKSFFKTTRENFGKKV